MALYGGRLLTSDKTWGQDMILARQHLCHFAARAMSYLEVYRLSRAELLDLARPFPIALRRIRWEALRLAMMRTLVATKRELHEADAAARKCPPPNPAAKVRWESAPSAAPHGQSAAGGDESGEGSSTASPSPSSSGHSSERVWQIFMDNATMGAKR